MGHTPPPGLRSFEEFRDWVVDHCKDWELFRSLYNDQEQVLAVNCEHLERARMFDVSWAPTHIRERHTDIYDVIAGSRYKVNQDLMQTLDPVTDAGAI